MASKVQICNLALTRLGAARVTNIDSPTTNEEKICNILFDDTVKEVMLEGSWTSTIRRTALAQTTSTPSFEYTYEYQLPVDPECLKVLEVDEEAPGVIDYRIEDDKLLTDESTIKIRYIAYVSDTESWDEMLKRAVVAKLSSDLAYALTGDTRKAELEYQRYMQITRDSLTLNTQQGSKRRYESEDLLEGR